MPPSEGEGALPKKRRKANAKHFYNAFLRNAAERRRGGATEEKEEGKCEAFIRMPSDDMPPSEGEGALLKKRRKITMRNMRRIMTAAALSMVLGLTACGGSDKGGASDGGYSFTSGSTKIEMGADASKVIEGLGEADEYFESESCAFEGLDKVYTYPGFKLNTYPDGDKDYVLSVVFMDDTVSTDKGISIGSTKDEVTDAYGEASEESAAKLVYESGDTELAIGLNGDSVSSVEISAVVEE